nr:MAG TPA: hypothetical protein [Caudoviricetes sp.]DAN55145.1 MAG TPA: hypothetical protein [Caudoviricetes sp.]DAU86352.1 MAG TPA: hypothetical protein [Caudoviricetes sp.]
MFMADTHITQYKPLYIALPLIRWQGERSID